MGKIHARPAIITVINKPLRFGPFNEVLRKNNTDVTSPIFDRISLLSITITDVTEVHCIPLSLSIPKTLVR